MYFVATSLPDSATQAGLCYSFCVHNSPYSLSNAFLFLYSRLITVLNVQGSDTTKAPFGYCSRLQSNIQSTGHRLLFYLILFYKNMILINVLIDSCCDYPSVETIVL